MKFRSVQIPRILFFLPLMLLVINLHAQESESENARSALKAGSSKELSGMLHQSCELVLFDKKYNKDNAEPVLRDFFTANPAKDFKYIHKGASKDGSLSYSIGHYETSDSKFRVVIRFKKSNSDYKIHKIEVSEL